jgi:hypothetical protein
VLAALLVVVRFVPLGVLRFVPLVVVRFVLPVVLRGPAVGPPATRPSSAVGPPDRIGPIRPRPPLGRVGPLRPRAPLGQEPASLATTGAMAS